jgi:exodeoxyribonuclease-3
VILMLLTKNRFSNPKENERSAGFTKPERLDMTKFLATGLIDTFRLINKNKVQYSWWSYRTFARDRNIGWRIDYFLVSETLRKNIKKAFIFDEIIGSDHCPVGIILKI